MRSKFLGAVSGFSFAHLLGGAPSASSKDKDLRDEDQTDETAEDEGEEDEAETSDTPEDEGKGGKKGRKAKRGRAADEDEEEDEEAAAGEEDGDDQEEDEDEEEDAETSGKKAARPAAAPRAAKGDAKKTATHFKRGRKAERARIGRILSNPAAARNIALACKLATNTGMSSAAAIALLQETKPDGRGGRLDDRMSGQKIPDVKSGGSQPSGSASIQQSWDVAMADFK